MIVITGAAGFIASYLAEVLNQQGRSDLILVDDFTTNAKRSNWVNLRFEQCLDREAFLPWFEENMCYFKCFGRDMETLLSRVKIVHGRRVFCNAREKRKLTQADLEKGMALFISNEEVKQRKEERPNVLVSMYLWGCYLCGNVVYILNYYVF